MARTLAIPQEDLRQIGCLGLLRAIDAFEPARGRTLSSFAVPYIRGAIQHELRDRASLMRIPRPLWDLRRRATVLQERRRRLGQPLLGPAQLAAALECSASQMVEALQIASVVEMRSLDAPAGSEVAGETGGRSLLEALADPRSLEEPARASASRSGVHELGGLLIPLDGGNPGPEFDGRGSVTDAAPVLPNSDRQAGGMVEPTRLQWLQQRLLDLSRIEQALLLGHVCQRRSWVELAAELGLHPRQAQRRSIALLQRLQAEARQWQPG